MHVVKRKFEPHPVETIHVKVVSICQCVSFVFVFNDLMVGNIDIGKLELNVKFFQLCL